MIAALPYATKLKPGSATFPLPGIDVAVLSGDGSEEADGGHLVIRRPWPGMMQGVFGNPEKYKSYFERFGVYQSGDGARVDEEGYYWILGRIDDSINVSGHRLSSAEIESALVAHAQVAEAAVVPMPHELKGEGIYAYVTLVDEAPWSEALRKELRDSVRKDIGPLATPEVIQFVSSLPKTLSGKIIRRMLRKIAAGAFDELGDTTSLAQPKVLDAIIEGYANLKAGHPEQHGSAEK
jgi:acetyl-CoA synthetase